MTRIVRLACAVVLLVLGANIAGAHTIRTGYVALETDGDSLRAAVTLDIADLTPVLKLDTNGDGETEAAEISAALPRVKAYVARHLDVVNDGKPVALSSRAVDFSVDAGGHVLLRSQFAAPRPHDLSKISVALPLFEDFGADYKVLARITIDEESHEDVLTGSAMRASVAGVETESGVTRGPLSFLKLGIEHIFIGIDHILFLLALIVIGGRFKQLVKIVTAFTLAHSVTLALAALQIVTPPTRLIESLIALTIVYVASENLWVTKADYRWVITGAFGLVHGFGFANVLRELGLPKKGFIASLVTFNLGVEIGQIVIVSLMWPLVWALSRSKHRRAIVSLLSSAIALVGLGWFLQRAFGLKLGLP